MEKKIYDPDKKEYEKKYLIRKEKIKKWYKSPNKTFKNMFFISQNDLEYEDY